MAGAPVVEERPHPIILSTLMLQEILIDEPVLCDLLSRHFGADFVENQNWAAFEIAPEGEPENALTIELFRELEEEEEEQEE